MIVDGICETCASRIDRAGRVVLLEFLVCIGEPIRAVFVKAAQLFVDHAESFLKSEPFLVGSQNRCCPVYRRHRQRRSISGEIAAAIGLRLVRLDGGGWINIQHERPVGE